MDSIISVGTFYNTVCNGTAMFKDEFAGLRWLLNTWVRFCVDLVYHALDSRADTTPVAPTLFVLSPLHPEGVPLSELADEVCLATNFRPQGEDMVLNVRKKRQINYNTSNAVISEEEKGYYYAGFANETIYSCELNGTSSNNENSTLDCRHNTQNNTSKLSWRSAVMSVWLLMEMNWCQSSECRMKLRFTSHWCQRVIRPDWALHISHWLLKQENMNIWIMSETPDEIHKKSPPHLK